MNRNLICLPVIAAFALAAAHVFGQTSQAPVRLELPGTNLNQFRVSARMGYNISAHLEQIGTTPAVPTIVDAQGVHVIPASVTGITYQDGYVALDSSGNAGDLSWYWGYANSSQIVGRNLVLSRATSGTLFADFQNDPQVGMEFSYARQLGVYQNTRYGIEAGMTYTALDLHSSGIPDPNMLAVDSFQLPINPVTGEPVIPPQVPYLGSYVGPGALIGATPTHYPVTIVSRFEASIYGLKVGPYWEFPVANRLSLTLNGGFALLIADSEFRIDQKVAIYSPLITSGTIKDSEVGLLPGAYIGGRLTLLASDSMNVFTGLEFETTGHHTQTLRDKRIDVDFWNSLYWTFGVSYSF